jgi:hypothetical protein
MTHSKYVFSMYLMYIFTYLKVRNKQINPFKTCVISNIVLCATSSTVKYVFVQTCVDVLTAHYSILQHKKVKTAHIYANMYCSLFVKTHKSTYYHTRCVS